jgi:putative redox protein
MRTEPFDFVNAQGHRLSGRLDRPDGRARAYALFAHCFTCDKQAKAAVRISRALAAEGVGTLRFDFTGLGDSEGEFSASGFSANVGDLISAAGHMEAHGCAPTLMIGHSLGGAAVLAAAHDIASVKAVATLGAPSEPAHVLKLLKGQVAEIEAIGEAEVSIGGRPFRVRKDFLDDVRMHDLLARLPDLRRALLIMHSPVDPIVGIDNASTLFMAARHPKCFVSLDNADHLLSRAEDAEWAARVIGAWAARYVGFESGAVMNPEAGTALVEETGAGKFQMQVSAGGAVFTADEPAEVGGLGSGPSPYQLVAAGLGACTAMTVRLYADQKGWPLEHIKVETRHDKLKDKTPSDVFERRIALDGPLDDAQRAKLFEIAGKCPVHRTLEGGSQVTTSPLVTAARPGPGAQEHFQDMQAACREMG